MKDLSLHLVLVGTAVCGDVIPEFGQCGPLRGWPQ